MGRSKLYVWVYLIDFFEICMQFWNRSNEYHYDVTTSKSSEMLQLAFKIVLFQGSIEFLKAAIDELSKTLSVLIVTTLPAQEQT